MIYITATFWGIYLNTQKEHKPLVIDNKILKGILIYNKYEDKYVKRLGEQDSNHT
jgi:hypothetical protein